MVESETGNWKLEPGHSRPTAASICNLKCLQMGGDVKSAGGIEPFVTDSSSSGDR